MDEKQFQNLNDQIKKKQAAQTPKPLSIKLPPKAKTFGKCACGQQLYREGVAVCRSCVEAVRLADEAAQIAHQAIAAAIPARYIEAELEDIEQALRAIYEGLSRGQGINLWGQVGRGKTYAMAAMCKDLIRKGRKCAMIDYEWFGLEIRATYQKASTLTELDVTNKYIKPEVLFVDDVGVTATGQETDFSRRTFTTLLNRRVNQMRPTFITSNKNLGEIAQSFDTRVASRLAMACVSYELKGKDKRINTGAK